jgi:hypothetical protein
MPSQAVTELFQEHVVAAMIKQTRLRESVGDDAQGWGADVPAGRLLLGRREFASELIGSEARSSGTFLWGWANPEYGELGRATAAVRRLGADRGIAELTDDLEIPADRLDAFTASVLTAGIGDLDAYYLAPLEEEGEGILALGIRDADLRVGAPAGATLASTFTNLIQSAPPFSHRRAFAHYLAQPLRNVPAKIEDGRVVMTVGDGAVRISFDDEGRIAEMRAELEPPG